MHTLQRRRAAHGRHWYWLLVLLAFGPRVSADVLEPNAYYFPRQEMCTVMMDFQKVRARLTGLTGDARDVELSRGMLAEWAANSAAKCPGAAKVTMMAVFIPGTDVYGRPDFGSRTNLLRVVGDADKLQALGRAAANLTMPQVRGSASVEVY